MASAVDTKIAGLAERQHGYVTREQLLRLGLGSEAIKYRIKHGRLITVYQGVYAVGHAPRLPLDRSYGALLACGQGAVLSHGSAFTLWGWRKQWRFPLEVTLPNGDRRPRGLRVHRSRTLTRADITTQLGIKVTSRARTLLDHASRLTERELRRAVNDARSAKMLKLAELALLIGRNPRHPGAKRLRPFIERPSGPTRSEFEDLFRAFCEQFELPTPLINEWVAGYEVDAFFPDHNVVVELDSWGFHSSQDSFVSDRDKDTDLVAANLTPIRITWERVTTTAENEASRLKKILHTRRR